MFAINDEMSGGLSTVVPVKKTIEKKISSEKLLEVSKNISLYYAPKISYVSKSLVVLPIDPQKIFVYWNLGDQQAQAISSNEIENELRLRICSQPRTNKKNVKTKLFYDFVIHHSRSSQTITLPTPETAMIYSASLGTKAQGASFIPLITCDDFPAFNGVKKQDESKLNNTVIEAAPATDIYDLVYRENQIDLIKGELFQQDSVFVKNHFASTNFSGLSR